MKVIRPNTPKPIGEPLSAFKHGDTVEIPGYLCGGPNLYLVCKIHDHGNSLISLECDSPFVILRPRTDPVFRKVKAHIVVED